MVSLLSSIRLFVRTILLFYCCYNQTEISTENQVNLPAGFRARIGLNETELTRALARGDFSSAEKLIEEASDPEYLNDGALAATPLNIVLTGRSSFFHQSRNLYLAHLLLVKGANPNLRIPNHDMETASESPIEMLLQYYLKLTEVVYVDNYTQWYTLTLKSI